VCLEHPTPDPDHAGTPYFCCCLLEVSLGRKLNQTEQIFSQTL